MAKTNALILGSTGFATVSNSPTWIPAAIWTVEFNFKRLGAGATVINAAPYCTIFFDSGNSNKLTVQIGRNGGGSVQHLTTSFTPALNAWHNYTISRDSAGLLTVLVDQAIIAGPSATLNPTDAAPASLLIGSGLSFLGNGEVGDIRIWNYPRTVAEAVANNLYLLDGNEAGLLANYQMTDGPGVAGTIDSNLLDASWGPDDATQHNGTISGTDFSWGYDCPVKLRSTHDTTNIQVTARLDYGAQASNGHLAMLLGNGMKIFGLNCDVFDEVLFDNDYASIYPEYTISQVPITTCKIMMGQPFDGIQMNDYISITQATKREFRITTDYQLKEQQVLRVYYPDGKTLNLRVVAVLALHPLSSLSYNSQCVVV